MVIRNVTASHMNKLLKSKQKKSLIKILRENLRNFSMNIEIHTSLKRFGIDDHNYESFLTLLIMERLLHHFKLNVGKNLRDEVFRSYKVP